MSIAHLKFEKISFVIYPSPVYMRGCQQDVLNILYLTGTECRFALLEIERQYQYLQYLVKAEYTNE